MYGILTRLAYFPWGTFGVLRLDGYEWWTAEREWADNEPNKSCIPEGSYEVLSHDSPKFGKCMILCGDTVGIDEGDAHRHSILIHAANWPDQLQGCIAPGFALDDVPSHREFPKSMAVTQSRAALQQLMGVAPDVWHLQITHKSAEVKP